MAQEHYRLSQAEINAVMERLKYLKGTRRSEICEALARARTMGDLSDNEEYDRVRYEQASVEAEIEMLDRKLTLALKLSIDPSGNHKV
ncbi:MAG: hypothetical protein IK130_01690 [Oscillospiraceae bacterium]|nr:hypothetical protein [Oscillospiraceae bacterium]